MWPDRVSNPGPPTYESGALPIALRGPADDQSNSGNIDSVVDVNDNDVKGNDAYDDDFVTLH